MTDWFVHVPKVAPAGPVEKPTPEVPAEEPTPDPWGGIDIPEYARIAQEERAKLWDGVRYTDPNIGGYVDEREAQRRGLAAAIREQEKRDAYARIEAMKAKRAAKTAPVVNHTNKHWDARWNRWVDDRVTAAVNAWKDAGCPPANAWVRENIYGNS